MKRIGNQIAMLSMLVLVGGVVSTGQMQAAQGGMQRTGVDASIQEILAQDLKMRSALQTIIEHLADLGRRTSDAGEKDKIEDVMELLYNMRQNLISLGSEDITFSEISSIEQKMKLLMKKAKRRHSQLPELANIIKQAKYNKLNEDDFNYRFSFQPSFLFKQSFKEGYDYYN
jgi:hypothetical protein